MANRQYIELSADRFKVGPLVLRALLDGGRIIQTEILLAGREWSEDKLLQHELTWYAEALVEIRKRAAEGALK